MTSGTPACSGEDTQDGGCAARRARRSLVHRRGHRLATSAGQAHGSGGGNRGGGTSSSRFAIEQIRAARDGRRLETAVHPELGEYVLYVSPQSADGDVHLACHLPGVLADSDPAQHLCLTGSEQVRGIPIGRHVRRQVEDRLAGRDPAQRVRHLADAPALGQEPCYAKILGLRHGTWVADIGGYDHSGVREAIADLAYEVQAVRGFRKAYFKYARIGHVAADRCDTLIRGRDRYRVELMVTLQR